MKQLDSVPALVHEDVHVSIHRISAYLVPHKTAQCREKDLVRQELARVRATAMEGSFGTQKEHYDLKRVKARTTQAEILYIFFGIHTAKVVHLEKRIEQRALLEAA